MEQRKIDKAPRNPWIAIDLDLATKPETQRICDLAECEVDQAVGRLVMFWSWVDRQAESELLPGLSCKSLVRLIGGNLAFWKALVDVGWLEETKAGLIIPRFESRFSESAKHRLMLMKRQDRHKMNNAPITPEKRGHNASITPERYDGVTKTLPRGRGRGRVLRDVDVDVRAQASDVGDHKWTETIDWDEAKQDANRALEKLQVKANKPGDRSLIIKAAAIKQHLGENWFWGAIEGAIQTEPKNPFAYLHGIWRTKCAELKPKENFDGLLASINVPEEILKPSAAKETVPT